MRAPVVLPCLAIAALGALSCRGERPPADTTPGPLASCPETVSVAQSLAAAAAGWEPFEDDTPTQLMSVGVFLDHPRERASLVPDSDTESAGRRVATWQLEGNGTRHYWLACYYDHSRIALTRRLASDITRVEVTRDPQVTVGGQPAITDIALK